MYRNIYAIVALLLCGLAIGACKTSDSSSARKPGRWLPYPEQVAHEEQLLRRKLQVERREGTSNTITDGKEVWYPSEITIYNQYGQATTVQYLDPSGAVTKEARSEYKDSLLLREVITESSGYSSALHYKYDDKGKKLEELLFHRGDSVLRRSYTLDPHGNEVEVSLHKFRDGANLKLLTSRDAMGRPDTVREIQDGKTNWTEVYTISDSLWRIRRTGPQMEVQGDYQMRFDAQGAITQMINRNEEGQPRLTITYTNDAQGRQIREEYFGAQGQAMQATESHYNAQGLLDERTFSSPTQPHKVTTKFTYYFRQ